MKQNKLDEMISELEELVITTNPDDLERSFSLFKEVLDLFHCTYFNPGEPAAYCDFCECPRPLPGCHEDEIYTSEEMDAGTEIPSEVYFARVWATRALDILDPGGPEEPCCALRERLWEAIYDDTE